MHLGLHPDTPDAEAQQALKNANRFFLTLYLDVRPDADAKANGLMQCERHRRTVTIFTIFPRSIPSALCLESSFIFVASNQDKARDSTLCGVPCCALMPGGVEIATICVSQNHSKMVGNGRRNRWCSILFDLAAP
jgi:hypothetical protein